MIVKGLSIFLVALIPFFFNGFYNTVVDIINIIISAFIPGVTHVVQLFPPNPCGSLIASCSDANLAAPAGTLIGKVLSTIAWLLPMSYLVQLVGCLMFSVMCYFMMAPLARWFKLLT